MESVHRKLERVRKPRVHITYEVEIGDAQEVKELPFVVGVMGDFSGDPTKPLRPLRERKFTQIDRDNFNDVMASMTPGLNLRVENTLKGDGTEFAANLAFNSLEDFEPARVAQQIEPLRKLLETRNELRDLLTKVDRSEDLEQILERVLQNSEELKAFSASLGVAPAADENAADHKEEIVMSDAAQLARSQQPEAQASLGAGLLEQAISATKQTEPKRAEELLRTLVEQALEGTVTYSKNLNLSIAEAIKQIDAKISKQLSAVMHHPKFQKLEGTWRGLHYMVNNTETSASLKIRVINWSKRELFRDLSRASEFDQSQLFKKIYESEFGTPGGQPYGALIGDYEFTNHPEDIDTLRLVSNVAAASFAPFIAAASPRLLGLDSFRELSAPRDLEKIFDSLEYTKWNAYRETEDSRFVTLVMPRVLARLPYGERTTKIDEFDFEEAPIDDAGVSRRMGHEEYCWTNAAYAFGSRLTDAFARNGWCTAIRGAENGGKVENLPCHIFTSDDGDIDLQCPSEIGITDRREAELSKLGFLALSHYKGTDYAVFFGSQTTQRAKKYDRPDATANAAISARLPYMMASSRIAHYLKVIARDKIGSFKEASDVEAWLKRWIERYTNANPSPSDEAKARYPLREARISVQEIPGKPGSYNAVAHMRPWLQMEELTTSLRMVARIPTLTR